MPCGGILAPPLEEAITSSILKIIVATSEEDFIA